MNHFSSDLDVGPDSSTEPESAIAPREQNRSNPPPPKRINVAVSPDMLAAIENLIEREQISLTEAVRRLVMYGNYIYRAVKEEGSVLVLRNDNREREVLLI